MFDETKQKLIYFMLEGFFLVNKQIPISKLFIA